MSIANRKAGKMTDELFLVDPFPKSKRAVILLHGLGSDHSSWVFQVNALSEQGFRPIAIDIPGFGQSKYSYPRWTIRKAALIIAKNLIDQLTEPVDVVGLSLGGTVAQQLVKIRPERIDKLVLASTFSKLRPSVKKNLPYLSKRFGQVVIGDIRKQAVTVADKIFPGQEQHEFHEYLVNQISNANPRIYRQAMIALSVFNSSRWMRKWGGPTLVITGSSDTTVTLENQLKLVSLLKNVKTEIITDGGHAISIDHTKQFNQILLSFLKSE
jgi:peroxiredoxin